MSDTATTVLVHGAPETDAIWEPLLAALRRDDVVRLSPPGFGAPIPPGFGCTVGEYRDWLIAELEDIGGPIDLVGHDWGGSHVVNVAMARPDLLRSWVTDAIGAFDPEYTWHELAATIAEPGIGEQAVTDLMGGTRTNRAMRLIVRGLPDARVASAIAAGQGEEMGRAALALYRSAVQPEMARRGRELERAAARPGLCVIAGRDGVVGTDEQRRRSARRAGAQVATVDAGHWWLAERPAAGAAAIDRFWRSLTC
jgi:pimeloyl-ACP methyl ester carboxylesterase